MREDKSKRDKMAAAEQMENNGVNRGREEKEQLSLRDSRNLFQ